MVRASRVSTPRQDVVGRVNKALDLEELVTLARPRQKVPSLANALGRTLLTQSRKSTAPESLQPLKELLARFLANNVDAITVRVLSQYTWTQVSCIWSIVKEEMLDSIEVFAKFACAFPDEFRHRKVCNLALQELMPALHSIIALSLRVMASANLQGPLPWALHLDLSHMRLTQETMLQLGSVPGLTKLKIDDSGVTDAVIQHWCRAHSAGGFAQLTLLDIRSSSILRLSAAIKKLATFSALALVHCDIFGGNNLSACAGLADRWHEMEQSSQTVLDIKTHLGSRADNRPLAKPAPDVFIDISALRTQLHAEKKEDPNLLAETKSRLAARKKQKLQRYQGQDTPWQQVL